MRALAVAIALCATGCAALGVIDDGTSVSWGKPNRGGIINPVRLPDDGDGYRVPSRWSERGLRYGTQELVDLVVSISRRVAMDSPETRVTVADLAWERGGPSQWHRSHQSGRDVDIVFFVTDAAGRHVDPEDMRHFDADGVVIGEGDKQLFDTARNWMLVRAIIEYQGTPVLRVFIYDPLKQMLLDHARAIGEPEWLIARAAELLRQPADSAKHDDHMHVRIMCSPEDAAFGCEDYGQFEMPTKKLPKLGALAWATWSRPMRQLLDQPMPAMLSLAGFPIRR
jgi:penicillin-insensitive murein endopeptidase